MMDVQPRRELCKTGPDFDLRRVHLLLAEGRSEGSPKAQQQGEPGKEQNAGLALCFAKAMSHKVNPDA